MKISVITVCRNAGRTIGDAIASFLAQTHPDKELIIVDGASTDGTSAIVQAAATKDIQFISEKDDGMYYAANRGLGAYSGDIVGMLNADDRFADQFALANINDALVNADIAFGNLDFVADDAASTVIRRWRGSAYQRGAFRRGWMPAHPTFYVRRNVIDAIGGFDTSYRVASDYDFMLRAMELHQFRTVFIDKLLVQMRQGGESTKSFVSHIKHNYEALNSRRRWLGSGIVDYSLFAKPLRKVPQLIPGWKKAGEGTRRTGAGTQNAVPSATTSSSIQNQQKGGAPS